MLAQLDIFMYIKAYSELMTYSGIFRTIDIFSQFHGRYSGITQEQFMHILNLNIEDSGMFRTLFRHKMFYTYSGMFTKLHSWLHLSRNIYLHSGIF